MRMIVREPVREQLFLLDFRDIEAEKDSRIQVRERIEILAVDLFNPLPLLGGAFAVANADQHDKTTFRVGSSKKT